MIGALRSPTPLPEPLTSASRVIVRLPNALGDCVMATPAIKRLACVVPPENLTLVGLPIAEQLLEGSPWSSSFIAFDRKGRHRGFRGGREMSKLIRSTKADLAVIFPNSIGAALQMFFAGVPKRLGYFKEGRHLLLTAGRKRDADAKGKFLPKYTGLYFDELLDLIPRLPPIEMKPQLFVDERGEEECQDWMQKAGLSEGEPFFIVVPGAAFGPSKIWLLERYAQVCDQLARERGARCLVSFGPGEEEIARGVKAHMRIDPLPDARVSLRGLKSIYKRASFVLTNDTGPRHLAVAFDIPNVTIMGPNDPRYTHLDSERGEVVREAVPCSPCQLKVCPLEEQVCMTQLSPDRVLDRCLANWPVE